MKRSRWLTKGLLSPLTLALAIVAPGLLYTAPAGAVETLDQSQTVSQSPTTVISSGQRAQVFTAGQYGWLNRVSLRLENYTSSPPPGAVLTVTVQTVVGGLPSGKQIGSGTIPLSAIPPLGNPDWVEVGVHGALMLAGAQYALVLQTSNVFGSVTWWYAYKSYTAGAMADNYGNGWTIDDNYDFTFQTYVVPDTRDQFQMGNDQLEGGYNAWAQVFTAGLSGPLDRVSVHLPGSGPNPYRADIRVSIQTVTGGYPSGTVIGRGSIPVSSQPYFSPGAWVTAGISDAVVTAGTQYALVLESSTFAWNYTFATYSGGQLFYGDGGWHVAEGWGGSQKTAAFETYVAPPIAYAPPPPPAKTTPCSSGVCPAVTGSIVPKDSTARVTSLVHFQELRDGAVHGILNFNDSRTGNLVLQGCTTESAACRLTVTTFDCTAQDSILVAGTYTPKGKDAAHYRLTLSGARDGIGSFTLTTGNYTYTLTRKGIVDVTCPPAAEVIGGRP